MKKFTFLIALLAFLAISVYGQETVYTIPAWDGSKIINLCEGGSFTVYVSNSTNGHTYNFTIADSKGLIQSVTGTGGTISFNAQIPNTGTSTYSVFDLNDFSPNVVFSTNVVAQPTAPTMTKNPNADVCAGTNVKATVATNGSGGVSGSNDKYEFSTDSGNNWTSYIPGTNISTTGLSGTDIVQVRAWRADDENRGCNSEINYYNWTVNTLPVPGISGQTDVCAGSVKTYTTETGMTGYTWSTSGGSGSSSTNSIDITWGSAGTGSVSVTYTDGYGCTAPSPTVLNVTKTDSPAITAVSLQSTLNQTDYQAVSGNLGSGYTLYLYACEEYTYLDVDALTATVDVIDGNLNPFFLDQTGLTQDWWDYWAAKNVTETYATANPSSWQANMWEIINGDEPIFYLKKSGADYKLIDGLQYQIGQGEQMLRISDDYPLATYTYNGELYSTPGCFSNLSITMTFEKGLLNVTQQKTYGDIQAAITEANAGDVIELCSGIYQLGASVNINKSITLQGQGRDNTTLELSSSWFNVNGQNALTLNASGIIVKNIHFKVVGKGQGNILALFQSNTQILNNKFSGEYVFGDGQITRATVWSANNMTGILMDNNIIESLRQPGYLSNGSGVISNNTVNNTRGWVIEGVGTLNFTGNIFGTNSSHITILNWPTINISGLTINNNDFSGTKTDWAIDNRTTTVLDATCNWFGTDEYTNILPKNNGPVVIIPYLLSGDLGGTCGGGPAIPIELSVNHTQVSESILVQFTVDDNDLVLNPIPGLDPTTPAGQTAIAALYQNLATALAGGNSAAIQAAAMAIGDDVITEYYYYTVEGNPATKTYLKTAGNNDLVKSKYWQEYLVRVSDNAKFPNWLTNQTVIDEGESFRTSTNPLTGAVIAGWLNPVLGRNLYVTVTFINNGYVNSITESIAIPAGCIVNTNTGFGYTSIQAAINAAETLNGHTIEVCAGTFAEDITLNKRLTINGAGMAQTIIDGNVKLVALDDATQRMVLQDLSVITSQGTIVGDTWYAIWIDAAGGNIAPVTLKNVKARGRVTGSLVYSTGLLISPNGYAIDDLLIEDCVINDNYTHGIFAKNTTSSNTGSLTNMVMRNTSVDNNTAKPSGSGGDRMGMYLMIQKNASPNILVDNIIIENCSFNGHVYGSGKGIYAEAISNALFKNVTATGNQREGIDLNLKFRTDYENIVFENCNIYGNAVAGGASTYPNLHIKGRNDGGTYGPNPALITDLEIKGGTYASNVLTNPGISLGNNISNIDFTNSVSFVGTGGLGLVLYVSTTTPDIDLGNTSFDGSLAGYIVNSAAIKADATAVLFDGKTGATASLAENLAIEDKVYHAMDATTSGLVTWKAGNVYATTGNLGIQRGVNIVPNSTVNVGPGTFNESVTVNKSMNFIGSGCAQTTWKGSAITNRSLLINRNNTTPANVHVEITGFSFETENNQSIRGDWSAGYAEALTLDIHDNCFKHVNSRNPGNDFALYVDGAVQTPRGTQGAIRVYDNLLDVVTGGFLFEYCRAVDVINNEFNVTYEGLAFNNYSVTATIGDQFVDRNTFNRIGTDFAFAMNNWHSTGNYTLLPSTYTNNLVTNSGFSYAWVCGVEANQSPEYTLNGNALLSGTLMGWGDFFSQADIDASLNWWGTTAGNQIAPRVASGVIYSPWLVPDPEGNLYPWSAGPNDKYSPNGTLFAIDSAIPTHIYCGDTDGSILVTFSGGTGPYDITWTGGSATDVINPYDITLLAAGSYNITVTDYYGTFAVVNGVVVKYLPVYNSTAVTYHETIQEALSAAGSGDNILICDGLYKESNITVNKPLTIEGQSKTGVVLAPAAVNNPTDASFPTGYQYAFLIGSSDVTIKNLTIDGEANTDLGVGHNYQGGVMTDHRLGILFNNITVQDLVVQHTYRRGIQIFSNKTTKSSGHLVTLNTVQDVTLGPGIVIFDGDNTISYNTIMNVPDGSGIEQVQWSAPGPINTIIKGNNISNVYTGIQSVYASSTSMIGGLTPAEGNTINLTGVQDEIGIILRDAIGGATVQNNIVNGSNEDAGIWLYREGMPGNPVLVKDNTLTALSSSSENDGYATGIFATDDKSFVGGSTNNNPVYATLSGNKITGFQKGVELHASGTEPVGLVSASILNNEIGGSAKAVYLYDHNGATNGYSVAAVIHENNLNGNTLMVDASTIPGSSVDAECNWWGTASGNDILSLFDGPVDYNPWLISAGTNTNPGFTPDPASCSGTPIVITSAVPDHITCIEMYGSINVSWTGGVANFTVDWGAGSQSGISGSSYEITGLEVGPYTITVTDANGTTSAPYGPVDIEYLPVTNTTIIAYYATIQEAIDAASANDVIEVCAGTYYENIVINKPLTLTGDILLPGNVTIDGSLLAIPVVTITAPDVVFQGFTVQNSLDAQILLVNAMNCLVQNNDIKAKKHQPENFEACIKVDGGFEVQIINNTLEMDYAVPYTGGTATAYNGILLTNGAQASITGNNIKFKRHEPDSLEACIKVEGLGSSAEITGNIIEDGDYGILIVNAGSGITIQGNDIKGKKHQPDSYEIRIKVDGLPGSPVEILGNNIEMDYDITYVPGTATEFNGISMVNGAACVITGNNIKFKKHQPDSYEYCIKAEGFGTTASISNNTIEDGDVGILIASGATATINNNSIISDPLNTTYQHGVRNETVTLVDATCNWWGTINSDEVDDLTFGDVQFLPFMVTSSGPCSGFGPVVNVTQGTSFMTIQEAIDDAATVDGDVIEVAAGIYTESLYIYKDLTLLGPNAGKNPNTDPRDPEAIIQPIEWYNVYFDVAGVTIDGFTLNGLGTCDYGIYAYTATGKGGLLFTNNIVENYTTYGFIGWVQSGPASSGNLITKNLFTSIGESAIVPLWNYYANVTYNVIQNTAVGIYAENANLPEATGIVEWKENTISATRSGIWYNLAYGTATSLTISDNEITYEEDPAMIRWDGIWLTSLGGSINPLISNNIITGADPSTKLVSGYHMWNNTTTTTDGITIQGGSVNNVDYGIWINNWDGYPTSTGSNAGRTKAKLDGLTITNADLSGLYLKDNPLNTNGASAFVYAKLTNTTISGSGTGILIQGDDASADLLNNPATITGNEVGILVKDGADLTSCTGNTITANTHGGIIIESTAGTIGAISGNVISGNGLSVDAVHGLGLKYDKASLLDAEENYWGDATGPYHTAYNTCGLGNAITGNVDFMPWYVDEDLTSLAGELAIHNLTNDTWYCTIQDAIDDADPNDEIKIEVATHTEGPQIVVDKNITLKGLGKSSTTLNANGDTGSSGDARGWILVNSGVEFNMQDMTLDGNGKNIMQGVRSSGTGTIDNVAFNDIKYPGYNGIAVVGFGNLTVQNSDFSDIGRIGIIFFGTGCTDGQAIGNTYTGKGSGNWIDYAVEVGGGAVATITDCYVSGNTGVALSDGSTSAAIIATTYYGAGTTATITGCTFTGNTTGIDVGYDGSDASVVVAHDNKIYGNSSYGIYSTGPQVDAENNWWGSNTGPAYSGNPCGTGDAVSANVDYDPWWNNDSFEHTIEQLVAYNVSGTTSLCIGGTTDIELSGSQLGVGYDVVYSLYADNVLVPGTEQTGTGDALSWTIAAAENIIYTVKAENSENSCTLNMTGSAAVYIGPVTTAGSVLAACPGSTIQIPVTVTDFADVGAISLTLNYDASVLTYVSSADTMGIANNNFVAGTTGTFTAAKYQSPWAPPMNLPDGATLLTITFTYNGGTTALSWNDSDDAYCEYAAFAPDYLPFCDDPTSTYYIDGQVTEVIAPVVAATVTGPDGDIEMTSGNNYAMTICSGEEVTTSDATSTSADPSSCGVLWVEMVYTTDISTLPATQTFNAPMALTIPAFTSITPENHDGVTKDITFVATPYYDVDNSGTLTTGDYPGLPITFVLTVEPMPIIEATVTAPGYSQLMVSGGNYAHTICSGIEITTTAPLLTSDLATQCGALRIETEYISTLPNIPSATVDELYALLSLLPPTTISPENHTGSVQTITFVSTPYYDADNSGSLTTGDITGDPTTFVLTVNPQPEVTAVTLLSSTDELSWDAVNGNLEDGYDLCINSDYEYYYLDIDALTSNPVLGSTSFVQNAFYLTGVENDSLAFIAYWAAKGVNGVDNVQGWELQMWDIITGVDPMFYIRYTGSDYQLIDGLQYQVSGGTVIETLRVSGDYPQDLYTFNGSVMDENGCISSFFDVFMEFNTIPHMIPVDDQVFCAGASVPATVLTATVDESTFSWTNSNTAIGLAASGSGNVLAFTATNTTNDPITATITVTPLAPSGCVGDPVALYTITVNPSPVVNAISNAVYCNGDDGDEIIFSSPTTGGTITYNWTSDFNVGFGTSGSGDISAYTATNSGSAPVVATVSVTATANGCTGAPMTFTVTVNPTPEVTAVTLLSSTDELSWDAVNGDLEDGYDLCINSDYEYYYLDIDALTSNPVLGSTSFVQNAFYLTGVENDSLAFMAYWAAKGVNGVDNVQGWELQMWDIITGVDPMFYIRYTGSDYQLIDGLQYQVSGGTVIETLRVSGDYPQDLYTFNGSVMDENGCISSFFDVFMEFNTIPHMIPVDDQVFCAGASVPATVLTATVDGSTFSWTNSNTAIGLAASGSGNVSAFTATNTTNDPITATITVTPLAPSGCVGDPVALYTITVNPSPVVNAISNAIYCNGDAGAAIVFTSPTTGGTITYNWTSDADVGFGTSGSGDIPAYTAANSGNAPVVATVSVTATANGCTGTATTFTVTVNPTPVVNNISNAIYCNGDAGAAITFSSPTTGGTITYNWTSDFNVGFGTGGSGDISAYTATNSGNAPVVATVSVTATVNGCTGPATTFTVTVNPTPVVNAISNAIYCNGDAGAAIVFTSPTTGGTITYNWTSDFNVGFGTSGSGDISAYTATNSGSAPVVATVSVTATANGCTGAPMTFTVTVNPTPEVTAVTLLSSTDELSWDAVNGDLEDGYDLCINSDYEYYYLDIDALTSNPVLGSTSFVQNAFYLTGVENDSLAFMAYWAAKGVNGVDNVQGWELQMWDIITGVDPMFYIRYTGSDYQLIDGLQYQVSGGTVIETLRVSGDYPQDLYTFNGSVMDENGCISSFFDVFMEFNTIPHMIPVDDQVFCAGASVPATVLTATVDGSTFSWTNSNTAIGLAASGSGNVSAFTATNTTNDPITATITVTPLAPSGCVGDPVALYTITVNPSPVVNAISNAIYCNGDAGAAIVFTSPTTGGTITYNWTSDADVGFGTSGSGDIPAYTAANSGNAPVVATVSVTATANGCTGTATTFTVTVNPTPVVNNISNAIYCNGDAGAAITFSSPTTGGTITYNWTSDFNVGFGTGGSGDISAYTATNSGNAPVVATVSVTATVNGCTGAATTFTVTVNPTPVATASVTTPITCNGGTGTVTITATVGAPTITYYFGTLTQVGNGVFTGISAGTYPWYIVDGNGCISITGSLTVTEPAAIPITGTLKYYNSAQTVMNNVIVDLKQGSSVIHTATTNGSGVYSFANVCPGTYDVVFTTIKPSGGINATDAALVNAWPVAAPNYPVIERVKFLAGDVSRNNSIQANDALRIQGYFLTQGNPPFENAPKWSFWSTGQWVTAQNPTPATLTITVPPSSTPITQDFWGMVTGDFDRSFTPGGAKDGSESLTLNYAETIEVESSTEFELPIRAAMDMQGGAISLILDYPSDQLEVKGVYLTDNPEIPLDYTVYGDELRIAWFALNPVYLTNGDALITLKLKSAAPLSMETMYFSLAADPLNELADGLYNVINSAVLTVDIVKAAGLGTYNPFITSDQLTMSNYPNPFSEITTITYILPVDGKATLDIYDIVGNKVRTLVDELQTAGEYKVKVNLHSLQLGSYTATLKLQTTGPVMSKTIKIISK